MAFVDKSSVEPSIFFIEKIFFSLKLFSGDFYGQSFIKIVRGPYLVSTVVSSTEQSVKGCELQNLAVQSVYHFIRPSICLSALVLRSFTYMLVLPAYRWLERLSNILKAVSSINLPCACLHTCLSTCQWLSVSLYWFLAL